MVVFTAGPGFGVTGGEVSVPFSSRCSRNRSPCSGACYSYFGRRSCGYRQRTAIAEAWFSHQLTTVLFVCLLWRFVYCRGNTWVCVGISRLLSSHDAPGGVTSFQLWRHSVMGATPCFVVWPEVIFLERKLEDIGCCYRRMQFTHVLFRRHGPASEM